MIQAYFREFDVFSEEEIATFIQLFERKTVSKNEFFVREGERCSEIALIVSGIFRSFYSSDKGDDITYCFRFPNDLMASYSSFITGNPSLETMQALSQSELFVIKKEKIEKLFSQNHSWTKFLKIIAEQQYLELEKRIFQLQKDSAAQRYKALLEHQPEYVQLLPLQYLASYLGITQRHLSRIRREISF
ncbi:Crp/Fnr family transcriptional regulator [Algoriphagus jejuensis]|uniref:Crp/Fnr family transcriptional regulator n=1 Tax=Algoriphagus jejuensis TaxID=419934 RepID=A0ABP3YCK7_9BACT